MGHCAGLDRVARIGVNEVEGLRSGALLRREIGDEHVGKLVENAVIAAAASHLHRPAIHVKLAIANAIQPTPRHCVLAVGHALWESPREALETVTSVGRAAVF